MLMREFKLDIFLIIPIFLLIKATMVWYGIKLAYNFFLYINVCKNLNIN